MNKPKIMPQNYLAILIGPWIFYYIVFFIFDIKFVSFNGIVIIPIILAIFLSILFYLIGYNRSYNSKEFQYFLNENNSDTNSENNSHTNREEPPYIRLLIILALIGCVFSLYFDVLRTLKNETFFSLREQGDPMLYSLRISKSATSELVGSKLQFLSKTLFPLSFFFYISNFTKKYVFYQWIIIILSLTDCLVTGGRFFFLYFFIIFITSNVAKKNIKLSNYFTFKNTILFIIFFYALLLTFSLRAPPNIDVLNYYKYSMGIESIALENINFGKFNQMKDNFLALIMYITHSFYFLSMHYESFVFEGFAYGGYTFNLVFRIINNIFNTNLVSIMDYVGIDPTLGRYGTFAKTLLSDFGVVGMLIVYSIIGYVFGISANYKNIYNSFRIIYYWLLVYYLLAPMKGIISTGFLNLMFGYLIIYIIAERKVKKKYKLEYK
tara:strand:- start:1406 stop:2716 length:1311 start_codon:yes stop_codon:yes gene_type:complete